MSMKKIKDKYKSLGGHIDLSNCKTIKSIIECFHTEEAFKENNGTKLIKFATYIQEVTTKRAIQSGISVSCEIDQELVKKYKQKVRDLGDMMVNVPKKSVKYEALVNDFFEEIDDDFDLKIMVKSGFKGDKNALFRMFIADGYKIDGKRIIGFVHDSLYDGVTDYEDIFTSAVQSRLPSVINASAVGVIGYIEQKMGVIFRGLRIAEKPCNSTTGLKITIDEKNKSLFAGRNIIGGGIVDENTIGEVELYSPKTCTAGRKLVCKKCYGHLSDNYKDGELVSWTYSFLTKFYQQLLLQSKHLIRVKCFVPEGFKYIEEGDYFEIDQGLFESGRVTLDEEGTLLIDGKEVYFPKSNLTFKEAEDNYLVGDNDVEPILLCEEGDFFNTIDINSKLPLIKNIFEKSNQYKEITDFDEYYKYFLRLHIESGCKVDSIVTELYISLLQVDGELVSPTSVLKKAHDLIGDKFAVGNKFETHLRDEDDDIISLKKITGRG